MLFIMTISAKTTEYYQFSRVLVKHVSWKFLSCCNLGKKPNNIKQAWANSYVEVVGKKERHLGYNQKH